MRRVRLIAAILLLLTGTAAAQTSQPPADTSPQTAQPTPPPVTELPPVEVVGASPLIGSGIDRNLVPAETQVLNSSDLTRQGTPTCWVRWIEQVSGVSLDSASGNPYPADTLLSRLRGLRTAGNAARACGLRQRRSIQSAVRRHGGLGSDP